MVHTTDRNTTSAAGEMPANGEVSFWLAPMKTWFGADYFVMMKCGDRELSLRSSRRRYQMEYHLAEINWLINGGEKPYLMDYTEESHPDFWPNIHPSDMQKQDASPKAEGTEAAQSNQDTASETKTDPSHD